MLSELFYAAKEILFDVSNVAESVVESHLTSKIMEGKREERAFGYANKTLPISASKPQLGRLVVQEHIADKAGPHWDMRIVVDGRSISFVYGSSKAKIAQGEKFSVGQGRMSKLIKQPDHTADYADFEGEIPSGYGKGKVRKVFDKPILIVKTNNAELQFMMDDQKITIFKLDEDWGMQTSGSSTAKVKPMPKGKYLVPDREKIVKLIKTGDYVAQTKVDGANFTMSIGSKGEPHLVSHRESTNGGFIDRKFRVFNSKFYGTLPPNTTIQGEIWHPQGPFITAGILNSNPVVAYSKQKIVGDVKFTAWDISKYNGKDVSDLPFNERRKILEKVGRQCNIDVVEQFKITESNLDSILDKAIKDHGEGLVLKNKAMKYGGLNFPMVKVKPTIIKNARIIGFTQGEGKNQGRLGALSVESLDGKQKAQVGTGFSDKQREYIWKNQKTFKGQVVEVEMMEETNESFRAPRFNRPSPTKSTIDFDQWEKLS